MKLVNALLLSGNEIQSLGMLALTMIKKRKDRKVRPMPP
jgi:hypothetical protein